MWNLFARKRVDILTNAYLYSKILYYYLNNLLTSPCPLYKVDVTLNFFVTTRNNLII